MEPLILTATLDAATQARFDELRRRHFPPERNHLDAHLTLFHHLTAPAADVLAAAAEVAPATPVPATISDVFGLGRGVAYRVDCPPLLALRSALAGRFELTPQDEHWSRPHVTVQNKVEPGVARALLEELRAAFAPTPCEVTGVALWRYLGGPWAPEGEVSFGPPRP